MLADMVSIPAKKPVCPHFEYFWRETFIKKGAKNVCVRLANFLLLI
jgi:hypothetical protein